jgi:hypothetical protein
MKNLLTLLLILFIIGILWLGSKYWEFSAEKYVNADLTAKSRPTSDQIDLDYLKKEFKPAYEF